MKNFSFYIPLVSFFIFLSSLFSVHGSEHYSIVFIHIGKTIPSYVSVALSQARLFNRDCPIIFIANQEALDNYAILIDPKANIALIPCETLLKTEEHLKFRQNSGLDSNYMEGFWLYTSERFLYLQDLMVQYGLKNVFHLENDNMLYTNLEEMLSIFTSMYKGIAITMDNDERCIPGFVYISNPKIMTLLTEYFANRAHENLNDMQILARFKNEFGKDQAGNLPIITQEYVTQQTMKSTVNHISKDPHMYYCNIDLFESIFDAAALGQYLGGGDPRLGYYPPGFINESCLFNPSLLSYEWIFDSEGRKIPFAIYNNKKYRINNLHIHAKNLSRFAS